MEILLTKTAKTQSYFLITAVAKSNKFLSIKALSVFLKIKRVALELFWGICSPKHWFIPFKTHFAVGGEAST
jgi:hypothetical protein